MSFFLNHLAALILEHTEKEEISLVELGWYALDAIVTQDQVSQTGEVSHLRRDRGDEVPSQIQHL